MASTTVDHSEHEKESASHQDQPVVHSPHETSGLESDADERLTLRTIFCVAAALVPVFAQVYALISSGVYAYQIATSVNAASKVVWLPNVGQVVISVVGPPASLAADLYGRRWFIVVGLALGWIGGVIAANSNHIGQIIAGLTIQGFGLATQPLCLAIASETLPKRYRTFIQGIANGVAGLGGLCGALISGAVYRNDVSGAGYKWILGLTGLFYFVGFVCFTAGYRPVQARPPSAHHISHHKRLLAIDWIGTFLLAAGLVPFLIALTWANAPYAWSSYQVYAPLTIGLVFFVLFGLYEWLGRDDGLLHHSMFRTRNTAIALVLVFAEGVLSLGFIVFWPQEQTLVYEHDAFLVGCRYAIYLAGFMVSAPIVGYISRRTGDVKILLFVGWTLFLISAICMSTAQPGSGAATLGYVVIGGIAWSFPLILLISIAQFNVPGELLGLISAIMLTSRGVGGAVGAAIMTAVVNTKELNKLGAYIANAVVPLGLSPAELPAFIPAIAGGDAAGALAIPGVTPEILGAGFGAAAQAYSDSLRYVWFICIAFIAVALIGTLFVIPCKKDFTGKIDAPADREVQEDPEKDSAVA